MTTVHARLIKHASKARLVSVFLSQRMNSRHITNNVTQGPNKNTHTLFAVLGNKECLVNNGREFIYVLELVCPLGAWPCQFNSGALLKSTRTHSGCRNLACTKRDKCRWVARQCQCFRETARTKAGQTNL